MARPPVGWAVRIRARHHFSRGSRRRESRHAASRGCSTWLPEPASDSVNFTGEHEFGRNCSARLRRLIERGAFGSVTVNQFTTVFRHGQLGSARCRTKPADDVCLTMPGPCAHSSDQERVRPCCRDLEQRGLLAETVVNIVAEMGRTPQINRQGGRDHFTRAWTNVLAGGSLAVAGKSSVRPIRTAAPKSSIDR